MDLQPVSPAGSATRVPAPETLQQNRVLRCCLSSLLPVNESSAEGECPDPMLHMLPGWSAASHNSRTSPTQWAYHARRYRPTPLSADRPFGYPAVIGRYPSTISATLPIVDGVPTRLYNTMARLQPDRPSRRLDCHHPFSPISATADIGRCGPSSYGRLSRRMSPLPADFVAAALESPAPHATLPSRSPAASSG